MATSHTLIYLDTIFVDRMQEKQQHSKREREISGLFIASFVLDILELIKEIFTRYFSRDPQSAVFVFLNFVATPTSRTCFLSKQS